MSLKWWLYHFLTKSLLLICGLVICAHADVFKQFTNKEGRFKDELSSDVRGMLSLYEAAHFLVHGEPILDEALAFTIAHLKSSTTLPSLCPFLVVLVEHALHQPIRKGIPRMEARHFISIYHEDPPHSEVLLRFAKLDFNIVQKLHQKDLSDATRSIFLYMKFIYHFWDHKKKQLDDIYSTYVVKAFCSENSSVSLKLRNGWLNVWLGTSTPKSSIFS